MWYVSAKLLIALCTRWLVKYLNISILLLSSQENGLTKLMNMIMIAI